jgi:GNAT superfamily N-acetyltransferase
MVVASGTGTSGVSERIEGVDRLPSPARSASPGRHVSVSVEPFESEAVRWVVAHAEAELVLRYGFMADSETGLSSERFDPPAGAFLVARLGPGAPAVGGVGLRPHSPDIGEVKRLWVDPAWRAQGISRALMGGLEATARQLGFRSLRLETGVLQPEAIALYDSSGWQRQHEDWEGGPILLGSVHFTKDLAYEHHGHPKLRDHLRD